MQSTATPFTTQNNHLHLVGVEDVNSSGGNNASDLVVGALRHQRDLFSGSLGIPDVTTRVGSVIHAFETMARQRQILEGGRIGEEKPYDSTMGPRYRSHRAANVKRVSDNRHKIILPSPKVSPSSTDSQTTFVQQSFPTPNSFNQFLNNSKHNNNGSSSNNLHINNNNLGQYFLHSNNHNNHNQAAIQARTTFQSTAGSEIHYNLANDNESSNFDSLNLDDDYRKSSFGKQSKLQPTTTVPPSSRNQHLNDATTIASSSTAANLRSSFHPAGDTEHNSFSRNNPNVFFNSVPTPPQPHPSSSLALAPQDAASSSMALSATIIGAARTIVATTPTITTTVASPQTAASTMRYYNHDNNNNNDNSGNRRSTRRAPANAVTSTSSGNHPANDDNEGDNNTSNDKFLRGTTVSQSFIKNVKNIRRKSSSYDLQSAASNASLEPRGGGTANSSSASISYKQQKSGALMTTTPRHLYRRAAPPSSTRAPGPSDNDTDELTTMAKAKESTSNVDNSNRSGGGGSAGSGKRKMFQPRTLDRAEI